ncbi:MAG: tRNA (guanine-N7)-methyltransferase [Deltaproteobacteria bacterium]|nr:tRNA (guanine-N7)-methyltransferase [Deltaproteobacteria bacterium]
MRIRQHVNPNLSFFAEFRGERPRLRGVPIEVEIGCADAQFLFERAAIDPGRDYVGLEIREELVGIVNRNAAKIGAPVHAVSCHAQHHLELIFGEAKVDRVYLNFPDPWFKKKHHDRRMIDATLADGIARVVRPGGDVFVQSDVWEIALDAMEVLDRRDDVFENLAGEWTFWRRGNPYGARSWRETNAEETGLPVWRLMYRRR